MEKVPMLAEGYEKLTADLKVLRAERPLIVDAIEEALHAKGVKPIRREGVKGAHWVLLDFGDVVVHVQQAEDRVHYAIERLWKDCPVVELPESVTSGQVTGSTHGPDYDSE